jgi:hypothetical protein
MEGHGIGLSRTFVGDFLVVVKVDAHSHMGGGMLYGSSVDASSWSGGEGKYGKDACGLNGTGFSGATWCRSAGYTGGYPMPATYNMDPGGLMHHARIKQQRESMTWLKFRRQGNVLTQQYAFEPLESSSPSWQNVDWKNWTIGSGGSQTIHNDDKVVIALGETGHHHPHTNEFVVIEDRMVEWCDMGSTAFHVVDGKAAPFVKGPPTASSSHFMTQADKDRFHALQKSVNGHEDYRDDDAASSSRSRN